MSTAASENNSQVAQKQTPLPPDEEFWQRYSPHHEASLSGVTSLSLHLLAIPLLLLVGWLAYLLSGDQTRPPTVGTVSFAEQGGGGSRHGGGAGEGEGNKEGTEERGEDKPLDTLPPRQPLPQLNVPVAQAAQEFDNDPTLPVIIGDPTEASKNILNLAKEVREQLRSSVNKNVGGNKTSSGSGGSQGQGGTGRDGGRDKGKDKGQGAGTGTGKLNQREKRMLRWTMNFNTSNGADYAAQLQGLGAIIALPISSEERTRFHLIRDLRNPRAGKVEDVSGLDRIYWVDNNPSSVRSFCTAIGMTQIPPFFAAFFPQQLEQELFELERKWVERKYSRRLREDLKKRLNTDDEGIIHETRFNVIRKGSGFGVVVREVTLRTPGS